MTQVYTYIHTYIHTYIYIYIIAGPYIYIYVRIYTWWNPCVSISTVPQRPLHPRRRYHGCPSGTSNHLQAAKKKILNRSQAGKLNIPPKINSWNLKSWWFGSDDFPFQTGEILRWTMFNFSNFRGVRSWELTYSILGIGKSSSKSAIGKGYVSFQEGIPPGKDRWLAIPMCCFSFCPLPHAAFGGVAPSTFTTV